MPFWPESVLTPAVPVSTSLFGEGVVESGWLISMAPMSGRLPPGCGRALPSWSEAKAASGSAPLRAGLATLFSNGTMPLGLSTPPPVSGSIAAKMALAAMFSASPGLLPATSLPKTLWPLVAVIVPKMSGPKVDPAVSLTTELPTTILLAMSSWAAPSR